jgi:shikimate dehydrogenase
VNISATTKVLGVIGDPIEHSMSPKMHNAALIALNLDYVYLAFRIHASELEQSVNAFRMLKIQGINVTIPHKVKIIPFLDEIDETARKIGAINTIKNENGKLYARNTDGEGAVKALLNAGIELNEKKIVILGCGGSARAISFEIAKYGASITILNRSKESLDELYQHLKSYYTSPIKRDLLSTPNAQSYIHKADILINTTPVGMIPNIQQTPIPKTWLHPKLFVFDIVYNPLETQLLKCARNMGCRTLDGLEMLVNQGALAFEWWTGKSPDKKLMRKVAEEHLNHNSQKN